MPWNDALIATLALSQGCRTYAVGHHFEAMEKHLGLRIYTPGYNGGFKPEG